MKVFYWREGNREVDFILQLGDKVVAIEVKSSIKSTSFPGIAEFVKKFNPKRTLLVGGQGIPLEEFLSTSPMKWLS